MSASWQLDGADLDTLTVKVTVEPGSLQASDTLRTQDVPRLHSAPLRHQLGTNWPTYRLRIRFVGPAADRAASVEAVRAAVKAATTFTITAPDAPNEVYFNGASKTVRLSLNSLSIDWGHVSATSMDLDCIEAPALDVTA